MVSCSIGLLEAMLPWLLVVLGFCLVASGVFVLVLEAGLMSLGERRGEQFFVALGFYLIACPRSKA